MFGAVVARGEAQTVRLATIYAVLDHSEEIRREHILAALALWEYAEESARYIFGDASGDPEADTILEALRANRSNGLTRTNIGDIFGRNKNAERIGQALALLSKLGKAYQEYEETGGRPGRAVVRKVSERYDINDGYDQCRKPYVVKVVYVVLEGTVSF